MNLSCEPFVAGLVDAAGGRRPSPELEGHLATCEACRAELDALRADLARLAPEPAPEPGPWLAARIRAAAEHRRHRRLFAVLVGLPAVAVAASVILVVHLAPGAGQRPGIPAVATAPALTLPDPGTDDAIGPGTILPDADKLDAQSVSALEASTLDPDGVRPGDLDTVLGGDTWGVDVHDLIAGASPSELDAVLDDFPG